MDYVNIQEAKTYLSRLLARVRNGEEIIVASRGKPFARIVPYRPQKKRATLMGADRQTVTFAKGFENAVPADHLVPFYEQ